jgi:formamidopyrimidine-DNA glycosylase
VLVIKKTIIEASVNVNKMAKELLDDHFQKPEDGPRINKLQRYQKYGLYTFFTGLFAIPPPF